MKLLWNMTFTSYTSNSIWFWLFILYLQVRLLQLICRSGTCWWNLWVLDLQSLGWLDKDWENNFPNNLIQNKSGKVIGLLKWVVSPIIEIWVILQKWVPKCAAECVNLKLQSLSFFNHVNLIYLLLYQFKCLIRWFDHCNIIYWTKTFCGTETVKFAMWTETVTFAMGTESNVYNV